MGDEEGNHHIGHAGELKHDEAGIVAEEQKLEEPKVEEGQSEDAVKPEGIPEETQTGM